VAALRSRRAVQRRLACEALGAIGAFAAEAVAALRTLERDDASLAVRHAAAESIRIIGSSLG
jgi:hypothetical protein